MAVDLPDRVVGCVVGLALGDALGAPFEFRRAGDIPQPLPAFTLPWQGLPAGTTTDDTAMARNLVRSLAERDGFDPQDLVARHLAWFKTDPPDVGNLTRRVLRRVAEGRPADEVARELWERRGPEVSAGNGSVMYCAPLGAAFAHRPEELAEAAPRLSALTHYDPRCRTAVLALTVAAGSLVRGEDPVRACSEAVAAALPLDGGEELEYLVQAVGEARQVDGPDQGFCLFAAAVGLQALVRGGPFDRALSRVVALGGDTDTNGAVAGALLGSAVGRSNLPEAWLARLIDRDAIEHEAQGLVPLAARR